MAIATVSTRADSYPTNIVQVIAEKTTTLLTAPLTVTQRQVLHLRNFTQLPSATQPLYLYAVAVDTAFVVGSGGQLPTSDVLALHFNNDIILAELEVVKAMLHEINLLTADQIANSASLQDAIRAGMLDGLEWGS
jgi:hypothetical protein